MGSLGKGLLHAHHVEEHLTIHLFESREREICGCHGFDPLFIFLVREVGIGDVFEAIIPLRLGITKSKGLKQVLPKI